MTARKQATLPGRGRARRVTDEEAGRASRRGRAPRGVGREQNGQAGPEGAPAGATRSCGRPRDPAVDQAIIGAAMELLAEEGFEGMSIEALAHRAGVSKPAIYRRWPSKRDLVADVLQRAADRPEMPEQGTVRERLAAFIGDWCRNMKTGKAMQSFSSLIWEIHRDPEVGEAVFKAFVATRKRKMLAVLREGVASGEVLPDVDVEAVVDMLFGAVVGRRLMGARKLTPAYGKKIVDMVFSGCCGHSGEVPRS